MKKTQLLGLLVVLAVATVAMAQDGPFFTHTGVDDLGNGLFKHHYLLQHINNVYQETDVTDVHACRDVTYDPGTILVEAPLGWEGSYDGQYYHWNVTDNQNGIPYGQGISGFTITVDQLTVSSGFVNFTDDPLVFDAGSIFATGMTMVPTPEPASLSLLALGGLALIRRRRA